MEVALSVLLVEEETACGPWLVEEEIARGPWDVAEEVAVERLSADVEDCFMVFSSLLLVLALEDTDEVMARGP